MIVYLLAWEKVYRRNRWNNQQKSNRLHLVRFAMKVSQRQYEYTSTFFFFFFLQEVVFLLIVEIAADTNGYVICSISSTRGIPDSL
jgi:hypothetical protein